MNLVRPKLFFNSQSGQVVLILLLIMVVGLTVGLAVLGRSVTSVKISTAEEDSQKAFYAAEAGLEEALVRTSLAPFTGNVTGASYNVSVTAENPSIYKFNDNTIQKDDTQTLWLSEHTTDGTAVADPSSSDYPINQTVDVCWKNPGSGDIPAMEVIILAQTKSNKKYAVLRGVYDPDSSRYGTNKFEYVSGTPCTDYNYGKTLIFGAGGFGLNTSTQRVIALRLRPLYNSAPIAVQAQSGCAPTPCLLPTQDRTIDSTGQVSGVNIQRKVRVKRSYASLPPIFDFVLFSGTTLQK